MVLLPLFCAGLLTGCKTTASKSASLYTAKPWPTGNNIQTQKDVSKYIVRGKTAYDSCTVNLNALKSIDMNAN